MGVQNMTNVEALKALYEALGGEAADVENASTSVDVLNAIAAMFDGESDAAINPDAIANIAAVAGDLGRSSANSIVLTDDTAAGGAVIGSTTMMNIVKDTRMAKNAALPDNATEIVENAFAGCLNLETVTIPSSVNAIGSSAFAGCGKLDGVSIPTGVTAIENATFSGCSSLKTVTIPNTVVSIGTSAFGDCTSLKSITIPESVTTIIPNAFSGCTSLETITINKPENSISGAPWSAPNATVVWTG